MFKNMKLSSKIYAGFAVVVVIAGVLGIFGWQGMRQVREQLVVYSSWGDIDMVMNEGVVQKVLKLDNALGEYENSQDEATLQNLDDAMTTASQGIEEWASLVDGNSELSKVADEVKEHLSLYSKSINDYKGIVASLAQIGTKWDALIADCLSTLMTTMEDVIDPAKEEAEQSKNIAQMVKWGAIDMVMNEAVIANVLKLQTAGHDYAAAGSQQVWDAFQQAQNAAKEGLAEWRETLAGETEMEEAAKTIEAYLNEYAVLSNTYHEEITAQQTLKTGIDSSGNDMFTRLDWAMESVIDPAKASAIEQAESTQKTSAAITLFLTLAGIVLSSCLAFVITRSIIKPLNRIIMGLTEGSEQVSSASGQVASASQSLAEGATEQAAGLEETSSSLEEMSSMTKQNADNSQQANTLASDARKAADNGAESMTRMNTAIQDIQKSSEETAKIIKVIDEIAFQTNLLALNAAVEAARAGEAGKGFAVVAEEVRNLAMRSAEAAKNTSSMIEESVKNSNNGVDIAGEVGKVLDEIVQGIGKTTDLVGEIAAASQEQAQGIDQVNTAVSQMDKVTQQNAANAEESASASEELSAQAEQMNRVVEELSTIVGGAGNVKQTRKPPSPTKNQARQSDHVLHQIAASRPQAHQETQPAQQHASATIPLDNDMNGFNA